MASSWWFAFVVMNPAAYANRFWLASKRLIDEHPATAGRRPKFWYATAQSFLQRLSEGDRAKADAYLEQFGIDVPQLLSQVEQRKDVYELVRGSVRPSAWRAAELWRRNQASKVVDWAVTTCCGNDGPTQGIPVFVRRIQLLH